MFLRTVIHLVAAIDVGATSVPRLLNLSEGALVVRTETLVEAGGEVNVRLYFPSAGQEIQLVGRVVWANEQLGDMALEFLHVSPGGKEVIAAFLSERAE